MKRITTVLMAIPFLAMSASMIRLAVLVTAAGAENILAANFYHAALHFVIAFVLLGFAGIAWRHGWKEARNANK